MPVWTTQASGTTNDLNGVWGSSANDVYIVGDNATILHSTGNGAWTSQPNPSQWNLHAVWGSGSADVYAGGVAFLMHSTGNGTWNAQTLPKFNPDITGIWGSSGGDVYACNSDGEIWHSPGNGVWTVQYSLTGGVNRGLTAIWGSSSSDVYAVGWTMDQLPSYSPVVLHSIGDGNWNAQSVPASWNISGTTYSAGALKGVWGSGAGDVYVVGVDSFGVTPRALHTTGNGVWSGLSPVGGTAIWGSGPADIYTLTEDRKYSPYPTVVDLGTYLQHWDGAWAGENLPTMNGIAPPSQALKAVWGSDSDHVYLVGMQGSIYFGP